MVQQLDVKIEASAESKCPLLLYEFALVYILFELDYWQWVYNVLYKKEGCVKI
jgi:hypothetical protein